MKRNVQDFEQKFQCDVRKSITGLHVKLSGCFTHEDGKTITNMLGAMYTSDIRLFLDVRTLSVKSEQERAAFKQCIEAIPPRQVIFKGEQGVQLGHQGNRILFMKDSPCKCAGACKSCACDARVKDRNAKFSFKVKSAV